MATPHFLFLVVDLFSNNALNHSNHEIRKNKQRVNNNDKCLYMGLNGEEVLSLFRLCKMEDELKEMLREKALRYMSEPSIYLSRIKQQPDIIPYDSSCKEVE